MTVEENFPNFFCWNGYFSSILPEVEVFRQIRQPRLRPIEALSGFGGEYRSRKEGRNFDCSDSWRILLDPHVLALPPASQVNSIFASKLHARDPLHWVICIRRIHWHGAHLQAVVIVMEILLPDPEKLPSSLWSRNLRVLPNQLKLIWPIKFKYSTKPSSDKC